MYANLVRIQSCVSSYRIYAVNIHFKVRSAVKIFDFENGVRFL